MTKITTTNIKKAIEGCYGNYSTIALRLGVDRSTITRYFYKHPEAKAMADAEREKLMDVAESQIAIAIKEGDKKVCMWFADNHGKERGYGKKVEMTANLAQELSFKDKIQKEIKLLDKIPEEIRKELVKKMAEESDGDNTN